MTTLQLTEGDEQPPVGTPKRRQLLPNLYDGMANIRPSALYALIPRSFTSYDSGYRKVTYSQLANAVNGVAWLISGQLGQGKNSETLAYVGPNDIGYIAVILGASKAGYSTLCVSPRNTKADQASLFATTKCKTLLTLKPPYSPTVETILDGLSSQPRVVHVPNIYQLLDDKPHPHFPYPVTFEAVKDEPLVVIHTSGTTNTPKAVAYTHSLVSSCQFWTQVPAPIGHMNLNGLIQSQRTFITYPFCHAGSLVSTLIGAVANQTVVVTPLGGVPPSTKVVTDGLKLVDVDAILLVTPFMEQIAKDPELLELVTSKVDIVGFGGGDISEEAGTAFATRVKTLNFNGSTETTSFPLIRPIEGYDEADWRYLQPHPCANIEFRKTPLPDLFEAVMVRNSDRDLRQPVFAIYPHLDEYRTHDLWSRHPTKPDLWLFRSRDDDMINSATGDMCNPLSFEQQVARHPEVAAALMVGTRRYQKALMVEPIENASRENFVDRIWAVVDAANQDYPTVSRVQKSHILLTEPDRPFLRAGKGTVQRAPSLKLYQQEIEELYRTKGDGVPGNVEPYQVHFAMGT